MLRALSRLKLTLRSKTFFERKSLSSRTVMFRSYGDALSDEYKWGRVSVSVFFEFFFTNILLTLKLWNYGVVCHYDVVLPRSL